MSGNAYFPNGNGEAEYKAMLEIQLRGGPSVLEQVAEKEKSATIEFSSDIMSMVVTGMPKILNEYGKKLTHEQNLKLIDLAVEFFVEEEKLKKVTDIYHKAIPGSIGQKNLLEEVKKSALRKQRTLDSLRSFLSKNGIKWNFNDSALGLAKKYFPDINFKMLSSSIDKYAKAVNAYTIIKALDDFLDLPDYEYDKQVEVFAKVFGTNNSILITSALFKGVSTLATKSPFYIRFGLYGAAAAIATYLGAPGYKWLVENVTKPLMDEVEIYSSGKILDAIEEMFQINPSIKGESRAQESMLLNIFLSMKIDYNTNVNIIDGTFQVIQDLIKTVDSKVDMLGQLSSLLGIKLKYTNNGQNIVSNSIQLIKQITDNKSNVKFDFLMSDLHGKNNDDLALRYSLIHGLPFVLRGNVDYSQYNQNGELDKYNPETHKGQLTDQYLNDRADYLQMLIDNKSGASQRSDYVYYDASTKNKVTRLPTGSTIEDRTLVIFGTNNGDSKDELSFTQGAADTNNLYIYAGDGDDALVLKAKNNSKNHLEGGADNDTYDVNGLSNETTMFDIQGDDVYQIKGKGTHTSIDVEGTDKYLVEDFSGKYTITDVQGGDTYDFKYSNASFKDVEITIIDGKEKDANSAAPAQNNKSSEVEDVYSFTNFNGSLSITDYGSRNDYYLFEGSSFNTVNIGNQWADETEITIVDEGGHDIYKFNAKGGAIYNLTDKDGKGVIYYNGEKIDTSNPKHWKPLIVDGNIVENNWVYQDKWNLYAVENTTNANSNGSYTLTITSFQDAQRSKEAAKDDSVVIINDFKDGDLGINLVTNKLIINDSEHNDMIDGEIPPSKLTWRGSGELMFYVHFRLNPKKGELVTLKFNGLENGTALNVQGKELVVNDNKIQFYVDNDTFDQQALGSIAITILNSSEVLGDEDLDLTITASYVDEKDNKIDDTVHVRLTTEDDEDPNDSTPNIGDAEQVQSPIIIDLNGDGVRTTSKNNTFYFDLDSNTFAEQSGWVDGNDGLLVLDRNSNGKIDNGSELFGNHTILQDGSKAKNGFEGLKEFDVNKVNKLDNQDSIWKELKVWQDSNQDGIVDVGELKTLDQIGLKEINLAYRNINQTDESGNIHKQTSTVTWMDGRATDVTDVWFQVDPAKTKSTQEIEIPEEIFDLPNIYAFGNVLNLRQAMALDHTLRGMIQNYISSANNQTEENLYNLIYQWTGSSLIDPNSRDPAKVYGHVMDARQLVSLENLVGKGYMGTWCWGELDPNPHGRASPLLIAEFKKFADYVNANLLAATSPYFKKSYNKKEKISIYQWDKFNLQLQELLEIDDVTAIKQLGQIAYDLGTYSSIYKKSWEANLSYLQINNLEVFNILDSKTIEGSSGNETLRGTNKQEILHGGAGNDILHGGGGSDYYIFEKGFGSDKIYDSSGQNDEIIFRGIQPEHINISRGLTSVFLTRIDDLGNLTNDVIEIQNYFDFDGTLAEGVIEKIVFSDPNRVVWTVEDILQNLVPVATNGDDVLYLDAEDNRIEALGGNDVVFGGDGDDYIDGGDGDDELYGDGGNDTLVGGKGNDLLSGGAGSDVYIVNVGDETTTIKTLNHEINDHDTIVFNKIDSKDAHYYNQGSDLLIQYTENDSVIIKDFFKNGKGSSNSAWLTNKVKYFKFKDNVVLTLEELAQSKLIQWESQGSDLTGIHWRGDITVVANADIAKGHTIELSGEAKVSYAE